MSYKDPKNDLEKLANQVKGSLYYERLPNALNAIAYNQKIIAQMIVTLYRHLLETDEK